MITGYNSEIDYGGVTYHIQTEDMGEGSQKIITHVFKGGAILLSKKTSYEHLLTDGPDEHKVKSLMNDQHKTIMKIIQSGKLETLRQKIESREGLAQKTGAAASSSAETPAENAVISAEVLPEVQEEIDASMQAIEQEIDVSLNDILQRYIQQKTEPKKLKIDVVAGTEIVSGQPTVLRIYTRDAGSGQPLEGAKVVIKVIGMTFRPAVYTGRTDKNGVYTLNIIIPEFSVGQAAILVQASSEYGADEMKLKVSRRI